MFHRMGRSVQEFVGCHPAPGGGTAVALDAVEHGELSVGDDCGASEACVGGHGVGFGPDDTEFGNGGLRWGSRGGGSAGADGNEREDEDAEATSVMRAVVMEHGVTVAPKPGDDLGVVWTASACWGRIACDERGSSVPPFGSGCCRGGRARGDPWWD